jgi:class 3 adenylate cyclase/CHASE2 domain-containing sensor protein
MSWKQTKSLKKVIVAISLTSLIYFGISWVGSSAEYHTNRLNSWIQTLENIFYDSFFKWKTNEPETDEITENVTHTENYDPHIFIIDIDEPSLSKLGNYNEWQRKIHADVIENLSKGGASAIGFDILFKNADFGNKKAEQTISVLKEAFPEENWDHQFPFIKNKYNDDSILIERIERNKNVILCASFDEKEAYKHESQWRPLSDKQRQLSLGTYSTFNLSQVDHPENIEPKDLLDNLFPELAQATPHMGVINAYPDPDGVVRHVSTMYRFPNPELYPNEKNLIHYTMSISTLLHLFHQDPKNVKVKMGEYINLGKPFGIYRDSSGLQTTYPQFSFPMFKELYEKWPSIQKDVLKKKQNQFFEIAGKIIVQKDDAGEVTFELFEGQFATPRLSKLLQQLTVSDLQKIDSSLTLEDGFIIKRNKESDRFMIEDLIEGEELAINPYIIQTIHYFSEEIKNLPLNTSKHLSTDLDLRYDLKTKQFSSNFIILNHDILMELNNTIMDSINKLPIGSEIRFGKEKKIPIDNYGRYQIAYKSKHYIDPSHRTFQHLSYYDVTKNRLDPAQYQGKIFILGSAATALFDFVSAPHEENFPAVLIHATIIQNILNDDYLITLKKHRQQIIILLLALLCMFIGVFTNNYISVTIMFALITSYIGVGYFFFEKGIYIGVAKPFLVILLTSITSMIVRFYFESKEKRFLNNAFKQYISPELIHEMLENEIMPTLGGEKSFITAYFTDIASFSTFSEQIGDPSKLVDLLNEYLTAMTDALLKHQGTLDKYEGDAIIAFFGAPMPLPNHAQSACETAIAMQEQLIKLRKKWASEKNKWPKVVSEMHMRIGINSGDIVTGNMGSSMRKNYTMMGDAVNLAARLESLAKSYGVYIFITETTYNLIDKSAFIIRSIDNIRVVGKSDSVKTYEIICKSNRPNAHELKTWVSLWEEGRLAYENQEWEKAISIFEETLKEEPHHPDKDPGSSTTPSHVYIERCFEYQKRPPVAEGEVWDKVYNATHK